MTDTGYKPAVDMSGKALLARLTGQQPPLPTRPDTPDTAPPARKPRVMSALGRHMFALAWFMAAWAVIAYIARSIVTSSYFLEAGEVLLANWLFSTAWALVFLAATFGFVAFTDYRLQTEEASGARTLESAPETPRTDQPA
jgi:hypothetical protein